MTTSVVRDVARSDIRHKYCRGKNNDKRQLALTSATQLDRLPDQTKAQIEKSSL